jgi:hypothetical protein
MARRAPDLRGPADRGKARPPSPGMCAPPPSMQSPQTPWLASVRPFLLASPSDFRAPPPLALDSATYRADLDEARRYGAVDSTLRTADEQATAWFWNANVIDQVNKALRDAAIHHNRDLVDTVRLLAMGDRVSTDAGIACFDSKYHYLFWRPITAIHADGDPADATWSPLVTTPNHLEYPVQHGCITAALTESVATAVGTSDINFSVPGAETEPAR